MKKVLKITAFAIVLSLVVSLIMPYAIAEDTSSEDLPSTESSTDTTLESSAEDSSEEDSSAEESSNESSQPVQEKRYLSFNDPDDGVIDVAKGFVGFEYSNGKSTYAFNYGDTAVVTITPDENADINFVELNGIDVMPENGVLRITMTEDYVLNVNFNKISLKTVKIECRFGSQPPVEVQLKSNGEVVADSLSILSGTAVALEFSMNDGSDIQMSSAFFTPDGGEPIEATVDNKNNTVTTQGINANGTLVLIFDITPKNITITQPEGGTITVDIPNPKMGDTVTFTLTPAEGYALQSIIINNVETELTQNTHSVKVYENITVTAVFISTSVDVNVNLSITPDGGGKTNGTAVFTEYEGGEISVEKGTPLTILITPDTGYEIDQVTINGNPAQISDTNTVTLTPNEDTVISVTFKKRVFRITAVVTAQGGGTISAVGYDIVNNRVSVEYGNNITFVFTPDMNYKIYSVKVDQETVYSDKDGGELKDNSFTFENVVTNHTIVVTFAQDGEVLTEYTIKAESGEHGSISPSGEYKVYQGDNVVYTITPDEGYEIDYVTVDGIDVSLIDGTYTFNAITADHIIKAFFKLKSTANDGIINVDDINWTTTSITIDLSTDTIVDKAVIEKIRADCIGRTIIVKANNFEVSFVATESFGTAYLQIDFAAKKDSASPNYTAISNTISLNPQYSSSVFTVIKLDDIFPKASTAKVYLGNDFAGKPVAYYTYDINMRTIVRADESISCDQNGYVSITLKDSKELVFIADATTASTYKVTVSGGENGTVNPTGTFNVAEGEKFTFTATPNEGYKILRITVNGNKINISGSEYEVEIKSDTVIEVRFALLNDEGSSKAGLIISIIIIAIAIVGGGVLFVIKWKQTKY